VTAFNASGDGATSSVVSRRTLMAAPTGLVATPASATSMTLSWTESSGETMYKIERFNGKTWALLTTVAADVHTYTNTGLLASRSYSYRLRATNAGGDSATSDVAIGVTPASAPVVKKLATAKAFQSRNPILAA
jgi:hypothetical protein